MSQPNNRPGLVYSTEHGRMCSGCGEAIANCRCRTQESIVEGDGIVRLWRETKGRRGKTVTVVTGVALPGSKLKALAKELKRICGTGGTVKEGIIELQGDHCDTVMAALTKKQYTVKRAGG